MIEAKLVEIRDAGTFIPALAVKAWNDQSPDAYLLRRAGYGEGIILTHLQTGDSHTEFHQWPKGIRTMRVAHASLAHFIEEGMIPDRVVAFDDLKNGQVLDVEYIIGLSDVPKESERKLFPDASLPG